MEINGKSPLIDLSTRTNRLEVQDQQAQQVQRFQKTAVGSEVADRDRVELSVRSREIQHINDLIQSTPDVREGLVQRVRQSLDSGTYNVKAEQVAERIICGSFIDQVF
jgi:negative regulator of flagellin synthesis FlgM